MPPQAGQLSQSSDLKTKPSSHISELATNNVVSSIAILRVIKIACWSMGGLAKLDSPPHTY